VSNNFALRYTASAKTPITSVEILVNGVSTATYNYSKPTVNDTKTINIPDAQIGTTHNIKIIATDGL